jgi:hypothetical protein
MADNVSGGGCDQTNDEEDEEDISQVFSQVPVTLVY